MPSSASSLGRCGKEACWRSRGSASRPASSWRLRAASVGPEPHVINQFHYPGYPDILILSNRRNNGEPIGLADAGSYFHTDYSYLEVPARLTMLYSIEVPSRGGNTLFANMSAAYDDLAESMKRRIDHLVVLHHYGNRDDLDEDRAPPPRS